MHRVDSVPFNGRTNIQLHTETFLNVHDNYDIDLFSDLINKSQELCGNTENKVAHKIIADHLRAAAFLIAEGILPAKFSNYALHLGLTEAGMGNKGVINTTAGLTYLLQNGIGDTIRASLTQRPGELRTNEVTVCQEILQSIGLR